MCNILYTNIHLSKNYDYACNLMLLMIKYQSNVN